MHQACDRFISIRRLLKMSGNSLSVVELIRVVTRNKDLIIALTKREIVGRYKGSVMGLLWSFFNPVLMLAVYTFVFGVVFKSKWPGGSGSQAEFALTLFSGLIIFNLFSECVTRAPLLIVGNINYVKKLIFPLEILPLVTVGAAFFHFLVSLLVWLFFYIYLFGLPSIESLYLLVIIMPLILLVIGLSWFLSSLGVYLRDVSQIVVILVTILMFMTPLFYATESLPVKYQSLMQMNPLSWLIEEARGVLLWNKTVAWVEWAMQMLYSFIIFLLGYFWFQKTRKGFADVL